MVEAPTHAALPKWLPLIVVPGALLLAAGAIVALVNPAMLASLSTLMVLTALIQLLDAGMDMVERRWPLIPGVVVFAVLFLFGAARITGAPVWRRAAWRDAS